MPLTFAIKGDTYYIQKITGKDQIRRHLAELGFVVGAELRVVSELAGSLIVSIKDSRIGIDKTMASRIMI